MKYNIEIYGPFGPNQSGKKITKSFDSQEERQDYINKPRQLVSVTKIWEE